MYIFIIVNFRIYRISGDIQTNFKTHNNNKKIIPGWLFLGVWNSNKN
jgi:hypothetical protein